MFIELIDQLRCPMPHDESWLVLIADHRDGRDVMEGLLGCPVCKAEYAILGGVVRFVERAPSPAERPSEEQAMRLAAFLDLTSAPGTAALLGAWGSQALLVRSLTESQLLLVNPPPAIPMGDGISGITAGERMPLARASLRALAIDASSSPALVASALEALRPGARILGPVAMPLPAGVRELVRDASLWVGERSRGPAPPSRLIELQRGR